MIKRNFSKCSQEQDRLLTAKLHRKETNLENSVLLDIKQKKKQIKLLNISIIHILEHQKYRLNVQKQKMF